MGESATTLGNKLRALRAMRGWSQHELAERVGVRELAVGKWERDQQNPSTENIVTLARVLGVDASELGYTPPVWTPEQPPEWFNAYSNEQTRRHTELLTALDNILNAIRARG